MTYWRRCKVWCRLEDSHVAPHECSTTPEAPKKPAKAKPGDEAHWQALAAAFRRMSRANTPV